MITYRAVPGVPEGLVRYLARLLAAERRFRGTPARSRKLTPRAQAVLALRWFRDRPRTRALARDSGISRATACRYVDEAVDVLAEQAPDLGEALERALAEGLPYVILDGKVFGTDACAGTVENARGEEVHRWYSGRKRRYGASVQAVMLPGGLPAWAGPAEPASVPDTGAARAAALPFLYRAAALGLPCLADAGYQDAGIGVHTPAKNPKQKKGTAKREPGENQRTRNLLLRGLRCQGERGFALLTRRWAALQHITASPARATEITRAALVLTQWEHKYLKQIL
ncbi:MAG TPA: transposase family protein [Bacillota bacterium]